MICTADRHLWSWGSNRSNDTPPPHIRCSCGRVRWKDIDALDAERARADRAELERDELRAALTDAASDVCAEYCGGTYHVRSCERATMVLGSRSDQEVSSGPVA